MAELTIEKKTTESLKINTKQDLLLTKKGSFSITQTKDVTTPVYAIKSDAFDKEYNTNTLTLNGKITVTDKKANSSRATVGIFLVDEKDANYVCTIITEEAKKLSVTKSTSGTSNLCSVACGIYSKNVTLNFDGSKFLETINVTVSNNKTESLRTAVLACGIYSKDIKFDADLAAPITIKATSKASAAGACGVGGVILDQTEEESSIIFQGIGEAITVTATGGVTATAYGIHAIKSLTVCNDIAGKIKVTATSSEKFAHAAAICSTGELNIDGEIKKAITVKSTAKKEGACLAYGVCGKTGVTLQHLGTDLSVTGSGISVVAGGIGVIESTENSKLYIKGDVAGKITVTATGSANTLVGTKAYGVWAKTGSIAIDGQISKTMTVKSTLKITETGIIESKITDASAYGVYSGNSIVINVGIKADIVATTTATANQDTDISATAGGCCAEKNLTIGTTDEPGIISGNIKATATTNSYYDSDEKKVKTGNATALGLSGSIVTLYADITKNITVSATANGITNKSTKLSESGTANAYGIYATDSVVFNGIHKKTISVKANSKANAADARGIYGANAITLNEIAADVSVSASGMGTVSAYAIQAGSSLKINGIADKKGVPIAIAGSLTAAATNNGNSGATTAVAIGYTGETATGTLTIDGNIKKTISATAKSKSTDESLTVAYGINAEKSALVVINGIASSTIKAEASGNGIVHACAINANDKLQALGDLGKISATASGASGSSAIGISVKVLQSTSASDSLTATITATCKAGTACGLKVASILDFEGKSETATLNITATGKTAYGIQFTGATEATLESSKITGKASDKYGEAYALYDGAGAAQKITLEKSTLTGDVDFGAGNDSLSLTNKSKVTGEVDMGDGTDKIFIHSGSQVKGDVTDAEEVWLVLDASSSSTTALWDGTSLDTDSLKLDVDTDILTTKVGKTQTFTLLKNTNGSVWSSETAVDLHLNGTGTAVAKLYCNGDAYEDDHYAYRLTTSADTKTMQLSVVCK